MPLWVPLGSSPNIMPVGVHYIQYVFPSQYRLWFYSYPEGFKVDTEDE